MERKFISCFKGLAPVSFPADWIEGMDLDHSFSYRNGEALIKFGNGRAFGVSLEYEGNKPCPYVRELSQKEIEQIEWGPFCDPWEPAAAAELFGHGRLIPLDEI